MGWWFRLTAVTVVCLLTWRSAAAQTAPRGSEREGSTARRSSISGASGRVAPVEESPVTTFMLRDDDGTLVEVPNFDLADFERAYRILHGLDARENRPRYSLQWLSIEGEAKADRAELTVEARVIARDDRWIRVPLRLNDAVLREPVPSDGKGGEESQAGATAEILEYDEEEGYVWWLRGDPANRHQLSLKLSVPISRVGGRYQMGLRLPRATASEFKLTVPMRDAEVDVPDGATLLPPSRAGKRGTRLTVLGVHGDFQLGWHRSNGRIAELPPTLEVVGNTEVGWQRGAINWETVLSVRSFAAPFDQFRVRLPAGAELKRQPSAGYTVTPLMDLEPTDSQPTESPETSEQGAQDEATEGTGPSTLGEGTTSDRTDENWLVVRLDEPTTGPVEVQLAARRVWRQPPAEDAAADAPDSERWVELAGFEVDEAVHQHGQVVVSAPQDRLVLWGPRRHIRRVDALSQRSQPDDLIAAFEYATQPFSLQARLVRRQTRIVVSPSYVMRLGARDAELRGTIDCSVRGPHIHQFEMQLAGWELIEVGPDTLIAVDGVSMLDDQRYIVPLIQPTTGDLQLQLRLRRPIEGRVGQESGRPIEFELPKLIGSSYAATTLAVVPSQEVRLRPIKEKMSGLARREVVAGLDLPDDARNALYFRGESSHAVFAAELRRLPRRVEVAGNATVVVRSESVQVEDVLRYQVEHEPLRQLFLDVPREAVAAGKLTILHEGEALSWRPVEPTTGTEQNGLSENGESPPGSATDDGEATTDTSPSDTSTPNTSATDDELPNDRQPAEPSGRRPAEEDPNEPEADTSPTEAAAGPDDPTGPAPNSLNGNESTTPMEAPARQAALETGPRRTVEAVLPVGCLGTCTLVVRYELPLSGNDDQPARSVRVPLIVPRDVELRERRVSIESAQPRRITLQGKHWRNLSETRQGVSASSQTIQAETDDWSLPLAIQSSPEDAQLRDQTVVQRAWIQSWLIPSRRGDQASGRQERAAFRFTTNLPAVSLTLPRGVAMEQVFVWLDGRRFANYAIDGQRIIMLLDQPAPNTPADAPTGQMSPTTDDDALAQSADSSSTVSPAATSEASARGHRLEVSYHFPDVTTAEVSPELELPRLGDNAWVRRMYWQVILPSNRHVLLEPAGFIDETPWQFSSFLWRRQPVMEQRELEAWSGAAHRAPASRATNRYLFSTAGHPEQVELRIASRATIVLIASGLALVVGLLLIYVPAVRHPATVFAAAVILLAVGLLYPAPTVLLAQAAVIGLVLTLVAGLLHRGLPRRRVLPVMERPSSVIEINSTRSLPGEARPREKRVLEMESTQTAPFVIPPSADQSSP